MDSQGVNENTLTRVLKSNGDYEKYKELHYQMLRSVERKKKNEENQRKETVEHRVTVEATHYMMEELKEHTKLLKLISNKLAVIVEDLYGKEESK